MKNLTAICKYFTYVFIAASSLFAWMELFIHDHWILALVAAFAMFLSIEIKDNEYG